jgi:ribosomal protein S18 acetylase RimI-like enzyme
MIEPAKICEIPDILKLCDACRLLMESKGIYQWTMEYPNEKQFINDIKRKELYVLKQNDRLVGCIVLSIVIDAEYIPVNWLTNNGNPLYIHRLAVHPNYQGKGFAQQLINFGENHARSNQFTSIRLDTFSQNKRNQRFYEQRGYQKLADIYFSNQSEHPFHCYELLL